MPHLNLFVLLFAIGSFLISPAMAAEKPEIDKFKLAEMVVTATKTEKTIEDVPANVSVITKEDLQRKNYVNLNEALESIPGVYSYQGKGIATP